ncbi:hypothetical protein PAMP_022763 [Pampus punctatissimus]
MWGGGDVADIQDKLEEESRKHADIIQMNFVDSYKNLTIKTMMMMKWLATHCPNAFYAMKVDADIFVNVFYLIRRLISSPRQGYITGSLINDGKPKRPNKKTQQQIADLVSRISRVSTFVRMIPLEDVYVGLCLHVLGIRPVYSRSLKYDSRASEWAQRWMADASMIHQCV